MASTPANPKLWQMIITQARARFATYPSPGASHWVHSEYEKHGGKFIESNDDTKKQKEMIRARQSQLRDKRAKYTKDDEKSTDKKRTKSKGKK